MSDVWINNWLKNRPDSIGIINYSDIDDSTCFLFVFKCPELGISNKMAKFADKLFKVIISNMD